MNNVRVVHFLADGRVGGPHVRIFRVHNSMKPSCSYVKTVVVSPPLEPVCFFDEAGIKHVDLTWHKPKLERPVLSGLSWLFIGLWKDVQACRKVISMYPRYIVHINGAILIAAVIAAIIARAPWVWHLNDTTVPRLLTVLVRSLLFFGRGKSIVASKSVALYFRLPKTTEIIYPPIDFFSANKQKFFCLGDICILGVMANLSPGKGIDDIVEAFAIALKMKSGIKLVIAGRVLDNKRWYYEQLTERIEELGISRSVEFVGFISNPIHWMRSIDLFLFSSHAEGAPVALIEALGCGLPIIAGEIPPTREVLSDAGVLVPLGDHFAMANAVLNLIDDVGLRTKLSLNAVERAYSMFSIEVIISQYLKVYKEIGEIK